MWGVTHLSSRVKTPREKGKKRAREREGDDGRDKEGKRKKETEMRVRACHVVDAGSRDGESDAGSVV